METKNLDNRGSVKVQVVRSSSDWSSGILTEHSIQNAYVEVIRNAQHYVYIENQFFITATGDQQNPIHNQIGRAIVDAVVRASKEGRKFRVIVIIPAVPGFAGDLREDGAIGTRAIMDYQYNSICREDHSIFSQLRNEGVDPTKHIFFFNLRSYDRLNKTPAIRKQEKESGLRYQDIQRAEAEELMGEGIHGTVDAHGGHDSHMGKMDEQKGSVNGMHRSRSENHGDLPTETKRKFEAARKGDQDTDSPFSVSHYAMAGPGKLSEVPWDGEAEDEVNHWIQEELYIHAKLLIADDRVVICGSSNLNDRSQLGYHDSELSVVMEDTRTFMSTMDGQPFEVGYHAATLRRYLWREHLGLLPPQDLDASQDPNAQPPGDDSPNDVGDQDESWKVVEDPLGDELWDMWTSRSTTNTLIFRQLFHADPDDHVKSFDDYNGFLPAKGVKPGHIFDRMIPPEEVRQKLDKIKGHLVWMPLDYLKDANMAERGLQVNSWTESVYT